MGKSTATRRNNGRDAEFPHNRWARMICTCVASIHSVESWLRFERMRQGQSFVPQSRDLVVKVSVPLEISVKCGAGPISSRSRAARQAVAEISITATKNLRRECRET